MEAFSKLERLYREYLQSARHCPRSRGNSGKMHSCITELSVQTGSTHSHK